MKKNEKQNDSFYKTVTKANYKPSNGRKFTLDSKTLPDDSLSIKQLLINHTRGLGIVPTRNGIYTGDTVAPRYVDLNDRKDAVDALRQRIDAAKESIAKEQAQKESTSLSRDSVEQVALNEPPQE